MKIYQEYLDSKHPGDDFLQWLLLRKITLTQQIISIFLLIALWLTAAPRLVFWVFFFKATIVIALTSVIISFIYKRIRK